MAEIKVNATASLTAQGTSTATGSISWTKPTLPSGAIIESVVISGKWTWGGKGSVSRVTINGTNTSDGVTFNITLSNSVSSPLSITCVGNKNATGSNFTWSNLQLTYTYSLPVTEQMMIKQNGAWVNVSKVYLKQNNVWVEQTDLVNLFDTSKNYVKMN